MNMTPAPPEGGGGLGGLNSLAMDIYTTVYIYVRMARTKAARTKKDRDHQILIELIKVFQGPNGFDAMLLCGAGLGSAVAGLSAIVDTFKEPGASASVDTSVSTRAAVGWAWVLGPLNPASIQYFADKLSEARDKDAAAGTSSALAGIPIHEILAIGGTGAAGTCLSLLYLRAIFGGGNGSPISNALSGVL